MPGATEGLPNVTKDFDGLCEGCYKGKQHVANFPRTNQQRKTNGVLKLVHSDVMGPMRNKSSGGSKYVLLFVDDYSRYVVGYFLESKSEVTTIFAEYKAMVENQWNAKLKCIRSDNGTELVNEKFDGTCKESGIVHQLSAPYSPQQNGFAERMNRTVMEMARSIMQYKGVEKHWWAEAINTVIYTINRITSSRNSDVTPYEICSALEGAQVSSTCECLDLLAMPILTNRSGTSLMRRVSVVCYLVMMKERRLIACSIWTRTRSL